MALGNNDDEGGFSPKEFVWLYVLIGVVTAVIFWRIDYIDSQRSEMSSVTVTKTEEVVK
jgi:hypothetical protein